MIVAPTKTNRRKKRAVVRWGVISWGAIRKLGSNRLGWWPQWMEGVGSVGYTGGLMWGLRKILRSLSFI